MTTTIPIPDIAVIIPFYQRQPGILRKAVNSICAQDITANLLVIVIDDESLVSAENELAHQTTSDRITLQFTKRPNGGPAAARNTGLECVPTKCRYVAFLDSDDEWVPNHLSNAWNALEAGYDFYFADHYQLGQTVGAFARAGRIDINAHPIIADLAGLHAYRGDMTAQILTGNIIGTSTVVFRRSSAPDLRFREEYRNAGEDYIFWLELSRITSRIAFSESCEAIYGRGVNIYSGVKWGTVEHMTRVRNELRFKRFAAHSLPLSPAVRNHAESHIAKLRGEYCHDLIHVITAEHRVPWTELKQQLRLDPLTISALPTTILSLLKNKSH
jgi:succinoglycan biosynthesis protein ExoW